MSVDACNDRDHQQSTSTARSICSALSSSGTNLDWQSRGLAAAKDESATGVARHVVDAIYGGRGKWNLQLASDLVRRDQRWIVTRALLWEVPRHLLI